MARWRSSRPASLALALLLLALPVVAVARAQEVPALPPSGRAVLARDEFEDPAVGVLGTPSDPGRWFTSYVEGEYLIKGLDAPRGTSSVAAGAVGGSIGAEVAVYFDNLLVLGAPDLYVSAPDAFGYTYRDSRSGGAEFEWIEDVRGPGGVVLSLEADNASRAGIGLPFAFPWYSHTYDRLWVNSNGTLGFGTSTTSGLNERLPSARLGGPAIAAFWDDLNPSRGQRVAYHFYGVAPDRFFAIEWESDRYAGRDETRIYPPIQVILNEDGRIVLQYGHAPGTGIRPRLGHDRHPK